MILVGSHELVPRLVVRLLAPVDEATSSILSALESMLFNVFIRRQARHASDASHAVQAGTRRHGWVHCGREQWSDLIGKVEEIIF